MNLISTIALASVLAASVGQIESKSFRGHVEQRDLQSLTPEQQACWMVFYPVAVGGMEFSSFAFDRYETFFRSDSTFTLAQTGVYKGVEGIKEYVKFGSPFSQYFSGYKVPDANVELLEIDGDICIFRTIFAIEYTFSDMVPDVAPFEVARMSTVYYNKAENYIPKVHLYYTDSFLNFFWDAVSTPEVHGFICDLLADECNADARYDYADLVGDGTTRPSKQECVDALASLPTSDNGYATENNQGCRALHAIMAAENPNHCPHIALNPTEDDNKYIKCNEYDNIHPMDLFDGNDIGAFKHYCVKYGIHPDTGYRFVESV